MDRRDVTGTGQGGDNVLLPLLSALSAKAVKAS